ncbi:alpha/beta fold hydrolase [Bradyrhizobium sp. UFLA05-153]
MSGTVSGQTEVHLIGSSKPGAVIDVVFVHGIGGRPFKTWSSDPDDQGAFWPRWLDAEDAGAQVWCAEYPAEVSLWVGRSLGLLHGAISLLDRLTQKLGERPIIFVCHSMGGLIVKQILRAASDLTATDEFRQFGSRVVGIVFLGTPHTGSDLANTAVNIGGLLGIVRVTEALEDLQKQNSYLSDLNDWFRAAANARKLGVRVYAEGAPIKGMMVVDFASANPGLLGVVPVQVALNHFELSKPISSKSQVAEGVAKFVRSLVPDKPNGTVIEPPPPAVKGDPMALRFATAFETVCAALHDLAVEFNFSGSALHHTRIIRASESIMVINVLEENEVRWCFSIFVKPPSADQIVYCVSRDARNNHDRWDESAQLNDDGKTFHINKVGTKLREEGPRYGSLSPAMLAEYFWKNMSLSFGTPFHRSLA